MWMTLIYDLKIDLIVLISSHQVNFYLNFIHNEAAWHDILHIVDCWGYFLLDTFWHMTCYFTTYAMHRDIFVMVMDKGDKQIPLVLNGLLSSAILCIKLITGRLIRFAEGYRHEVKYRISRISLQTISVY